MSTNRKPIQADDQLNKILVLEYALGAPKNRIGLQLTQLNLDYGEYGFIQLTPTQARKLSRRLRDYANRVEPSSPSPLCETSS